MKKIIQESFRLLIANRYLLFLCGGLILLTIAYMIYVGVSVRPSELQLVSHYSAFGVTHLYRDQWFYLLSFGVFGLFVAVLHTALAIKILLIKGHSLAILFAWLGIAIILLAWMTTFAVLNVWSPS
jgi:hypothetical protein